MLKRVAEGVLVHTSAFCQSNTVVVDGPEGVLLVDPGILDSELECLANDLKETGRAVAAGFSTHPHWDHLLWHPLLGAAPRYATARGADTIRDRMEDPEFSTRVAAMIPPDIAEEVSLDLLGRVTGLDPYATSVPWGGPTVAIVDHLVHAPGHAGLLLEKSGVLIAGDMLSDVLIPLVDATARKPVEDYLGALALLEHQAAEVDLFVPGHGSVGDAAELRERIRRDRAYLEALRSGDTPDDPRLGPAATYPWVADVHERQRAQLMKSGDFR